MAKRQNFPTRLIKNNLKASKNQIFGIHPVIEAIKAGREIDRVFLRKGARNESFTQILSLVRQFNIPFQYVPVEKLNRITGGNHQGIIAQLSLIEYKHIEEIVQRTFETGKDPFIAVLDRITDTRNFGAIARTAEGAGIDALVIAEKGAASITPDAIKTSAGALIRLAICRTSNLENTVQYLKDSGIAIVSATEKASENFYTSNLLGPVALVMGSEEDGISPAILKLSDKRIKIPMQGNLESLNVGVAFGILSFEIVRQRKA
jgi:23S rRNA (guanosine2251-2'-O)-methyltransferase